MYRDKSNQSGDVSALTARLDMAKKGFIVSEPLSRDSVYDFLVETPDGIESVQVKTMCGNSITKVVNRSGERVSANGKIRNSIDYAQHGIDWLVGVHKDGRVFYYRHENYSNIPSDSFSVNKYPSDEFPLYEVPNRHTKPLLKDIA